MGKKNPSKEPKKKLGAGELEEAPKPVETKSEHDLEVEDKGKKAADKEVKAEKSEFGKDAVDVVRGNRYLRTFSKEDHGADWKKLAEEFASKDSGRSLVAPVAGVVVSWRAPKKNDAGILEGYVSKEKKFDDKEEALRFANEMTPECKAVCIVAR